MSILYTDPLYYFCVREDQKNNMVDAICGLIIIPCVSEKSPGKCGGRDNFRNWPSQYMDSLLFLARLKKPRKMSRLR